MDNNVHKPKEKKAIAEWKLKNTMIEKARKTRYSHSETAGDRVLQDSRVPHASSSETPAMPLIPISEAVHEHRDKMLQDPIGVLSLVAKQLTNAEVQKIPDAKKKIAEEWDKLRALTTWDETRVCEYEVARTNALRSGREAHFGRLFAFCVEKHSELPVSKRAYKGRVVFQGNQVKNAEGLSAVFSELGTSASLMPTSKLVDAVAMLPGCAGEQSDAIQAYTQALLYQGQKDHVETWIRLPKDQWPSHWHGQFKDPVVPLRLALYGHPLSGAFWEKHSHQSLVSVGFEPIVGWECCFINRELQLVLTVYVDDLKWLERKKTSTKAGI